MATGNICRRCLSTAARIRAVATSSGSSHASTSSTVDAGTSSSSSSSRNQHIPSTPKFPAAQNPAVRAKLQQMTKLYQLSTGNDPDLVLGRKTMSSSSANHASSKSTALSSSNQEQHLPRAPRTYEIAPLEDPLLGFLTNLMMKDGKKATARKHVALLLTTLRQRSKQHPMSMLREAIRLASPSVRIAQQKRGGKNSSIPLALSERQRVHKGIQWILDASDKRGNPNAGGSKQFGERVAIEVEAVLNGTSEVLKKKDQLHTTAMINRANVVVPRS